jgi:hypothetical protein
MQDSLRLVQCLLSDALALVVTVIVKSLQVHKGNLRGLLDLTHNLFSKDLEVLLQVHELLQVNHRVKVSHHEQLVLTASHIHIYLVHRNVLGISIVGISLHLRVVLLQLSGIDVE